MSGMTHMAVQTSQREDLLPMGVIRGARNGIKADMAPPPMFAEIGVGYGSVIAQSMSAPGSIEWTQMCLDLTPVG